VPAGSARPKLLLVEGNGKDKGGPLILSGGRPGLYLWINVLADGVKWEAVNIAAAHNAAVEDVSLRFCDAFVADDLTKQDTRTGVCTLSM
jgi:hypothetical protein